MKQIILDFPKQFKAGSLAAGDIGKDLRGIPCNGIFVCAMGGSALPGELLKLLTSFLGIKIPVHIHKDYNRPLRADKDSLIIAISYSGNTEETLSAFSESLASELKVVAITSGGKLTDMCREKNIPLALIPQNIAPRMAIGYQFSALIKILENAGLVEELTDKISEAAEKADQKILEKAGKSMAESLTGKIALIYSSERYKSLAFIFKILLNENSKIPAFFNCFPELDHNEMESFNFADKNFAVLILKSDDENLRIAKRMEITADIIKSMGIDARLIGIEGNDIFQKIINSLILFYWTSFYLAETNKVNPLENHLIDELKRKMAA